MAIGRPKAITAETVRDGLGRGLSVHEIAKAAGCSLRAVDRRIRELERTDPAAAAVARAAGRKRDRVEIVETAQLARTPRVVAPIDGGEIDPRFLPPDFDETVSDADAARAFLRWALKTPLGVDPAKIAACRVLLSDMPPPPPPAVDVESLRAAVLEATAAAETEGDEPPPDLEPPSLEDAPPVGGWRM